MGFGYKTSWIAVKDRSPEMVADALNLADRQQLTWTEGTELAYGSGVFVVSPIPTWTLAHSALDLADAVGSADGSFPDWLGRLSAKLGEVQYFSSHRVSDYFVWARAVDGEVLRACEWGDASLDTCVGEPTEAETLLGMDLRAPEQWQQILDDEDGTYLLPGEETVLAIAASWGLNPADVYGIHGSPPESPETAEFKALLEGISPKLAHVKRIGD